MRKHIPSQPTLQSCHPHLPVYLYRVTPLERFLNPAPTSLKVCGITRRDDALALVRLGVDALGANFWPQSKRHIAPRDAAWLGEVSSRILRVGVFVNQPVEDSLKLWHDGLIDVIQLHGDESEVHYHALAAAGAPFFQAIGITPEGKPTSTIQSGAAAVLLDAYAPGIYGGTGVVIDWNAARTMRDTHSHIPVILAGGITADNAAAAIAAVRPAALDTASGVESAPGIKDLNKVARLIAAIHAH